MSRKPFPVCRVSELGETGAFYTQHVDNTPVLVTRDAKGVIRAFVNLCRHRDIQLVYERRGVTKSFVCIMHGWSYDAEGNMGGSPLARMAQTYPMLAQIRTMNALTPLPCELRHGFVWVVAQAEAPIDVAMSLGPLDEELTKRDVERYVVRERTEGPATEATEAMRFVLRPDEVDLHTLVRRHTEPDFGGMDSSEDLLSLEILRLRDPHA